MISHLYRNNNSRIMINGTRSSFSSTRNLEIADDSKHTSISSILSYLDEEFDLNEDSTLMTHHHHAQSHHRYHYYTRQEQYNHLSSTNSRSIHTATSTTRNMQQCSSTTSSSIRGLRSRNSHLSAIEPVFDEEKIQELLDLVGSINEQESES